MITVRLKVANWTFKVYAQTFDSNANRKRTIASLDICRASKLWSGNALSTYALPSLANFQFLARNHERHLALLAKKFFLSFLPCIDSVYDIQLK